MTVQPLSPQDVVAAKLFALPAIVIECFNRLIAVNFDGRESIVSQDNVVREITSAMKLEAVSHFKREWLEVESIYRAAGWNVAYDKPGYNESGTAKYIFTIRKKDTRDGY